ncbi:MAG TPA: protein kinase, partial [Polyangiales bacterium]|nr:protein kinase [Polyangiales bacterium]
MREGDLLEERFRIEHRAGQGAMGTVFRALDVTAAQTVAVKTFRLDPPAPVARFAREAEALASLNADGVVRYVHHGRDEAGQPFLVMEWIEGPSLAERLHARALQPLAALQLAQRLAQALAAVHRAGIVHRDLKPSNIMLPDGELTGACIVDFGIARLAAATSAITTQRGQLGTPRYMAPEQIRDAHAVDGRADVFALGCVLFECLTGAPAFGGDDPVSVIAQILFQPALEPSALVPALPEPIDRLLERLLARERSRRPEAAVLADELAAIASSALGRELAALPTAQAADASAARDLRSEHTRPPDAPPTRPSRPQQHARATLGATVDEPPLRLSSELWRQPPQASAWPGHAGALIGRERELDALSRQLASGAAIALWGGAGVGKTRLALEIARRAVGRDAVLLVDLGAARSTQDAVREVADRAGLMLPPTDRPELLVGALLAKLGKVLLVLDRVEPLAGQIEPLIRLWANSAAGLALITTSRVRLRLEGAFELGPLATIERAVATAQTPSVPALSPAACLLLERVRAVLPELPNAAAIDRGTAVALERVASGLDGIPLALELAAARVSVLGLDGLFARLSAPLELLADRRAGAHADPLRAALLWSWSLLGEYERAVFMQCALFRGGFELAAAQAVVALADGAPPLPVLLQTLREQSLLVGRAAPDDPLRMRLSMLAPVRELALEQWAEHARTSPAFAAAADRHARYYAARARRLLSGAEDAGTPAPAVDARLQFQRERENARAAIEHALSSQPAPHDALALLRALEPELLARGPGGELALWLERALALAAALPAAADRMELEAERTAARLVHARLLAPAGQSEQAKHELRAVLHDAERLQLPALQASAWLDLGVAHHFARELEPAGACYQRALELLASCDDVVSEARCSGNLAAIAHDRGELQAALQGYRQAIALLEPTGEQRLLANFCGNRALCEHELEQLEPARTSYQRAIVLLEPLGDARLLGIVLSNFGTLELEQQRPSAALALHERACALLEGAGDPRSHALARGRRAVSLALLDRPEDAERDCAAAERSLRRDPVGSGVIALLRAFVDIAHGREAARGHATAQAQAELASA